MAKKLKSKIKNKCEVIRIFINKGIGYIYNFLKSFFIDSDGGSLFISGTITIFLVYNTKVMELALGMTPFCARVLQLISLVILAIVSYSVYKLDF